MRKALLTAIAPIFLLAACGGAPSKSDVKEALLEQARMFGEADGIEVEITDMNCDKTGDETYTCEVLAEVNGAELSDRVRMTKLGGKWRMQK